MGTNEVFDRLSRNLSSEQRRAMLGKLRETMVDAEAPIGTPEMEAAPPSHEEQFGLLGVWDRLLLWFVCMFTGSSREEVLDAWAIRSIVRDLQRTAGSSIDLRNGMLREGYARDLSRVQLLAKQVSHYFDPVRDDRAVFISVLAERFLPDLHRETVNAISEESIAELDLTDERALRHQLTTILDEKIAEIDPAIRTVVRDALRLADRFARIVSFAFSSMLESFDGSADEENRSCVLHVLSRPLERLSTLFAEMGDPVNLRVIETLVVYSVSEEESESDDAFAETVQEAMKTFGEFEEAIRIFVRRYPPIALVRIIKEDPHWKPIPPESTGDWVAPYRSIFVGRISALVARTTLIREMTSLVGRLKRTCGVRPSPIAGLPDGSRGVMSRYWYSGLVVATMSASILQNIRGTLKILLVNGEFYKASNRAQFNDAYENFGRIPVRIAAIEAQLRPEEAWGAILWTDPSIDNRREIADRVDEELRTYLDSLRTTWDILVNVLGGVLYARAGSAYDTIANYGQIGGRRNAEYIEELQEVHQRLGELLSCLIDADNLQERAREYRIPLLPERILNAVG